MITDPIQILDTIIGGIKVKDMTALTFLQWLAKKLNNLKAYDARVVKLTARISSPPMGRMTDEEKVEIIILLQELGVEIN